MNELVQMSQQPWAPPAAALIVMLVIGLAWPIWRSRVRGPKDSRRMYTADDRARGFGRAGGQCEYDRWLLFRCTRTAEHGDHFYPWSKGGATSMQNFVAACPRCNCSKGARVPSSFTRARIQARRGNYFPPGISKAVGEWARSVGAKR